MPKSEKILLCSDCFHDEGLSIEAFKIGIIDEFACPNCSSLNGRKLTDSLAQTLSHGFFVRGTLHRSDYGAAPILQANKHLKTEVNFNERLIHDTKLLADNFGIGIFYYGPRMWMVGEVEPLKDIQHEERSDLVIKQMIELYPTKLINEGEKFYRVRVNPKFPNDHNQYDSPPLVFSGNGRLDSEIESILYASQDLEICIHESRTTVEDELFVATLSPIRPLKLLDLSILLEEDNTEFESIDMTIQMLFYAGKHSYGISRKIAKQIRKAGFDGLIYPSYFSTIRTGAMPFDTYGGISIRKFPLYTEYAKNQVIPNIALFGHPVKDAKVSVDCINRVFLNQVKYDIQLGPTDF